MAKEAMFVVTLDPAPTIPVTLNYMTRDGTATVAAGNYTTTSGSLTFASGQTTQSVYVPVSLPLPDGDPDELFYLDITWPTGSVNTLGHTPGICTLPGINTPVPVATISNVSVI